MFFYPPQLEEATPFSLLIRQEQRVDFPTKAEHFLSDVVFKSRIRKCAIWGSLLYAGLLCFYF